jgi:uncharacterized repeat protein (TIGR01451 family)
MSGVAKRPRAATILAIALLLIGLTAASPAAAAPALEVTSSHGGAFTPGSFRTYSVSLRNVGDAPVPAGSVTIVDTIPANMTAVGASGAPFWSCSIGAGGQTVTCTGPSLVPSIPPGSETCALFATTCPISIKVQVDSDAVPGTVSNEVQASGGGAPSPDTHSDPTEIVLAPFGIVDSADAPALPDRAFWAGTCDLDAAPEIGQPIAGGIGSRPANIFTPNPTGVYANPNGPFTGTPNSVPAPDRSLHCIDHGTPVQGVPAWFALPSWRLPAETQAAAHADGSATMTFDRAPSNGDNEDPINKRLNGSIDNLHVDLPPGFVGDPTAVPKCTNEQFGGKPVQCPPESQVGVAQIATREPTVHGVGQLVHPVYNLEPREGRLAEFGIPDVAGGYTNVRVVAKARTNGDFGVTTFVPQIPAAIEVYSQSVTLWGVPWAEEHDLWRPREFGSGDGVEVEHAISESGLDPADQASYDPSWGAIRPFVSNPTECDGQQPITRLAIDSYENPGSFLLEGDPDLTDPDWKTYEAPAPPVTGCGGVPFDADIEMQASNAADAPTGLTVDLSIPQNDDPPEAVAQNPDDETGAPAHWHSAAGRATAQLSKAVVSLPEGFSVNPSGAAGLDGCSDAEIGLVQQGNPPRFDNEDPFDGDGAECPAGSRIGTVVVDTPLLEEPLRGVVVLGDPKSTDPQSGQMFRLFIVVVDEARGLVAKIYGSAVADPRTGRLTATFDRNPRVPFENMELRWKGGPRSTIATPPRCGARSWASTFSPWTAEHGQAGQPVSDPGSLATSANCGYGFSPKIDAGTSDRRAGGSGAFSFKLTRADGEQRLSGVSATLPAGLLGSVRDVPLCSGGQAAAGACPAASRIGTVDAGAGAGLPFFLEKKGTAYLTEGYKGAPYGLMVKVPVEAGPFRGAFALKPIVVRQALHVDRTTAQVTAVSDPLPQIHHGIPLRVRQVMVKVDRPGFMRNPTDCSAKSVVGRIVSADGAIARPSTPFQASGCGALSFRPRLGLRLTGRRQVVTGRHPGVRAVLTQAPGEAGVRKTVVRLPLSLALDPENAQALCEYDDGTKPDLEKRCPAGSKVGRARAVSPLLKEPLAGDVYFVKNVRFGPTGNRIATLPMIVVALRGEIAVNLRGVSSTTKAGKLVSTFDAVPDAPTSRFNLNIEGGADGILAVTRTRRGRISICRGRHVAEADFDGQNGRRYDRDIRFKTPCRKRKAAAKRR